MRNFKYEIQKDIELEEKLLMDYERQLMEMPEGNLVSYRKNNKLYYKYCFGQGTMQKHLGKEDGDLIQRLKRKAYLKKAITYLKKNLNLQGKLLKEYQPYVFISIQNTLGKTYQQNEDVSLRLFDQKRGNAFCKNGEIFYSEGLIHVTLAGFSVRSKSEAFITNALYVRNIKFLYEGELKLEQYDHSKISMRPDFMIYTKSGDIIIWEHLGLLNNNYDLQSFATKLRNYYLAGFTPGSNLIITADDTYGGIDMASISKIIDTIEPYCLITKYE